MKRFRVRFPSPAIAVSLIALVIAAAGTGYASQIRGAGHARTAAAKKPRRRACLSAARLCPGLRGAVDREIAAYVLAHRRQLVGARGPQGIPGTQGIPGAQGVGGAAGPAGPSGVGVDGIFGSGADGSQTLTGDTALTRDMYYNDLTIAPGVTLNPGGFRVFVAGTLTLGSGARISRDGPDASGASGAAGLVSHVLGGSGPGAPNFICAGGAAPTNSSLGGSGGNAGGGGVMLCPGGPVTPPAADVGGPQAFDGALQALTGRTLDGVLVSGGAGGGGTGADPTSSGGAGGGVVVIAARSVRVSGNALITANGGNGSADGGGGGGGVAIVISTAPQPHGLALSAAGGGASPHTGHPGFSQWFS
jgi:hypothetical protein